MVLFAVAAATVAAAPTQLALKFKKGETCERVIQLKGKGSVGTEGQQIPLNMTMTMRMASQVVDVKPDGAITMESVLKEFKMGGVPGMPGEMDLSQMLGLDNKPVRLTLDQKGKVINTEGFEQLSSSGMPGGMMDSPEMLADYPFFTDKPVDIGDTWQDQSEKALPGSPTKAKRIRDYVLRAVREVDGLRVAVIGVTDKTTVGDTTINTKLPMGGDAEMTQHINSMDVETDGEMLLDIVTGRVLGEQARMKINQDVSISAGGPGQQARVKTRMDMDATTVCNYGDQKIPDLSALYTKRETPADRKAKAEEPTTSPAPIPVSARLDRVKADMKALANALEMFFIDNNKYPLPLEGRTIDKTGIKIGEGVSAKTIRLDAPVAYVSEFPRDPFNPDGGSYRYFSDGNSYVLVSDGPNQKPDYDEKQYKGERLAELKEFICDPTQGEATSGDIIQVGP
jgi:hypothetical protein